MPTLLSFGHGLVELSGGLEGPFNNTAGLIKEEDALSIKINLSWGLLKEVLIDGVRIIPVLVLVKVEVTILPHLR